MSDIPALPPGFVIQNAPTQQGDVPPLPPGFVLDQGPPGRKPRPGQSYVDWLTELDTYNRTHRASPGEFLNNIDAAVRATARGVPVLGPLADKMDPQPEKDAKFAAEHPVANAALPILGGLGAMATAAIPRIGAQALGITGRNIVTRTAAGITSGAAIGAGDAAMRGTDPLAAAEWGALFGGAAPAIGRTLGRWFSGKPRPNPNAAEEAGAASRAAYQHMDRADIRVKAEEFDRFASRLMDRLKFAGYRPNFHAGTKEALDALSQMEAAPSIRELDLLVRKFRKSATGDESFLAEAAAKDINGFIENLRSGSVIGSGDPRQVANSLFEARSLWSRMRKAEVLDSIAEAAQGSEKALRRRLQTLLNNPKRLKGFTDSEIAAMQSVANGGPVDKLARIIGSFSPDSLKGMMAVGMTGGVPGIAVGGAGLAGKMAANAGTRNRMDFLRAMVGTGTDPRLALQLRKLGADQRTTKLLQGIAIPQAGRIPIAPPLYPNGR